MELQQRKNIRLSHYEYSTCGGYFVTICTHNRRNSLSYIRRGDPCGRPQIQLSQLGQIVADTFPMIEQQHAITIDSYVIMPNHIHFVVIIPSLRANETTLGQVVGSLKSIVSHRFLRICKERNQTMGPIWQRNYYEHVIRNDQDLCEIQHYIDSNPDRWQEDKYYTL